MPSPTHKTSYERLTSYFDGCNTDPDNGGDSVSWEADTSYRPDPDVVSFVDSAMRLAAEEATMDYNNGTQSSLRHDSSQRQWPGHTRYFSDTSTLAGSDSGYPLRSSDNDRNPVTHKLLAKIPKRSSTAREWRNELLATGLSIICSIAVLGILLGVQNKPSSSWPFRFSPASVISQLMTVSKSAMMLSTASCISQSIWLRFHQKSRNISELELLDRASRGPFGASVLLYKAHKFGVSVSLACIITITSLFMNSFTQQVLSYPSQQQEIANLQATFPVAQLYSPNPEAEMNSASTLSGPATANVSMQAAIVGSLYGYTTSPIFSCPASSCTWPRAVTLGFCASCDDFTAVSTSNCSQGGKLGMTICDYHTPSGQTVSVSTQNSGMQKSWTSVNTTIDRFLDPVNTNTSDGNSALFRLTVSTWKDRGFKDGPNITTCTLNWCAKVYNHASVTNTSFNLPVYATYPLSYAGYWLDYSGTNMKGYSVFEASSDFPAEFNNTFTTNIYNVNDLTEFLASTMQTARMQQYTGIGPGPAEGISLGAAVLANPSVEYMMHNMAESMTDAMRSLAGTQAIGTSWQMVQYTAVHWIWLILPGVVTMLGVVLLAITIFQNRDTQAVIWKTSALALLFHPLAGWNGDGVDDDVDVGTLRTMGKAAKSMQGQLKDYGDQGLRIVKT